MFCGTDSAEFIEGSVPQDFTAPLLLSMLAGIAVPWGLVIVFLVIFLAFWEKRRSLREILSSLGLKSEGSPAACFGLWF